MFMSLSQIAALKGVRCPELARKDVEDLSLQAPGLILKDLHRWWRLCRGISPIAQAPHRARAWRHIIRAWTIVSSTPSK